MEMISGTLRRATSDVHDAAERRLDLPASLTSRDDVDELLRRWHVLAVELAPLVGVEAPHGPPPVAPVREVLLADLAARGLEPALAPGTAIELTGAERAGAAYVLAGAQAGVRRVGVMVPEEWMAGSRFLRGEAAVPGSMPAMRRWLDGWDAEAAGDMIAGARAAFARSAEILGAGPWDAPLPSAGAPATSGRSVR